MNYVYSLLPSFLLFGSAGGSRHMTLNLLKLSSFRCCWLGVKPWFSPGDNFDCNILYE